MKTVQEAIAKVKSEVKQRAEAYKYHPSPDNTYTEMLALLSFLDILEMEIALS